MTSISIAEIRAAREAIGPYIHRTPLFRSATLSDMTGAHLWLKAENLQKTGSFKPRGVINAVLQLTREERGRGVATYSAGNTGQALAYAGAMVGVAATVVMPENAATSKVDAIKGYGAEIILVPGGRLIEITEEIQRDRGLTVIEPFGGRTLIAGHASTGLEILEDLPDVEVVVIAIGGGGLISGVAVAMEALGPGVKIIGVEPEHANVVSRSLAAGKPVRFHATSVADGLNAPTTAVTSLEVIRRAVDHVVTVRDEEITRAMALILQRTKLLVEPSGAAAVAALLSGRVPEAAGKKTVAILSGGNVDFGVLAELILSVNP